MQIIEIFLLLYGTLYAFITNKKLYNNIIHDEELIWFGKENINSTANIDRVSSQFNKSGLYSLRKNSNYMMIVCNNLDHRPSQMDGLHFDLWYKDFNILCDSGTYSYANNYDKQFTMTKNHNTIQVEDLEQMRKIGQFLCYDWIKCKTLKADESEFIGILVSNNGGYTHEKSVKVIENGFKILDKINTKKDNQKCYLYLHTPYYTEIQNSTIIIKNEKEFECKIIFNNNVKIQKQTTFISSYYYEKIEATEIKIENKIKDRKCEFSYEIKINSNGG